jgi:hypothetical protein
MSPGTVVHGGKQMELRIASSADEFEFFLIHYTPNYRPAAAAGEEHTDYMQTHFALEPGEHPKDRNAQTASPGFQDSRKLGRYPDQGVVPRHIA